MANDPRYKNAKGNTVRYDGNLQEEIQELVDDSYFGNFSEAARSLTKLGLEKWKKDNNK